MKTMCLAVLVSELLISASSYATLATKTDNPNPTPAQIDYPIIKDPDHIALEIIQHYEMGVRHLDDHNYQGAINEFEAGLKKLNAPLVKGKESLQEKIYLGLIESYYHSRNWDKVIETGTKLREMYTEVDIHVYMHDAYSHKGEIENAIAEIECIKDKNREDYFLLGSHYYNLGRSQIGDKEIRLGKRNIKKARKNFNKALDESDPTSPITDDKIEDMKKRCDAQLHKK